MSPAAAVRSALFLSASCAVLLCLSAGCGPRFVKEGTVPFPAEAPVFTDSAGRQRADLPPCAEPVRIVLLDFVWCPPCADVWKSLREASRSLPAGSVHVYRILFDRERQLTGQGTAETPPLRAIPPPDAGTLPVTTLTALPKAFRESYGITQVPVLLLLDGEGRVSRRWIGSSPSLSAALVEEVRRLSSAPPLPGT